MSKLEPWEDIGPTVGVNPKDAAGSAKVGTQAIPENVIMLLGLAMMEGARKYGRHNFREVKIRASVYKEAFDRHTKAWWEGEDIDPDSGLPHIIKAMATLTVLADSYDRGYLYDDRPPALPAGWMNKLNALAAEIIARYPDPKPPHTEKKNV
jgi:hypothetical protein